MTTFTPEPNQPENMIKVQAMPEIIRAATPTVLATLGAAMIIVALLAGKGDEKVYSSIATVATAAFSGAAGLAQPGKSKSDSSQ